MACYHPMLAYRSRDVNPSGKRGIVFKKEDGLALSDLKLPCGQCIGCRLEYSRQWAIRCVHEASLYEQNCFITLTYAPDHLPDDGSLRVRDFQLFMKRLRKKFPAERIRFYHCGEYGAKHNRPHYHACLFNFDFQDRVLWKIENEIRLYVSEVLNQVWNKGFATVGDVTFDSAAYVARYITKKINGDRAKAHYEAVIESTGEIVDLKPEYTTMSRRPGIARDWYEKYKTDVYPDDFVVLKGKVMRPPKFYDTIFEIDDIKGYELLKKQRKIKSKEVAKDNTPERLKVKEMVKKAQMKQLPRTYED